MAYSSYDDIISKLAAGKACRADWMKILTGVGTMAAGRCYDLTPFQGSPVQYIHGNLASNYDFQGGAANWTLSSGGWTWTAATHLMTKVNTGLVETITQDQDIVAGGVYEVIWTLGSYAGAGNVSLSLGGGVAVTRAASGTFTETVTAGAVNKQFLISVVGTVTALTVDLIYVRRLLAFTPYKSADGYAGRDMGMWHGGDVASEVKQILNTGCFANTGVACPAWIILCDFLGVYPKVPSNTSSIQAFTQNDHVSNGTFTGSAAGWVLGAGWTYNANAVDKGAGAGVMSQTTACAAVASRHYLVKYTISNYTVGGLLTIGFGGTTTTRTISGNGTYVDRVVAVGAGDLTFQTVDAARWTIDDVSCGFGVPRYTDGKGVRAFPVVNTLPGTGANSLAVNYVNQDLVRPRGLGTTCTATASAIVGHLPITGVAAGNLGPFLPLFGGDGGLHAIEDIKWSAASGSAGFHDWVLVKELLRLPVSAAFYAAERELINQIPSMPQIQDGAVLGVLLFTGAITTAVCQYMGFVEFGYG